MANKNRKQGGGGDGGRSAKQRRQQKIKKREQRQLRQKRKKLALFDSALKNVGLLEVYDKFTPLSRSLMRKWVYREPAIELDPSMADCPLTDEIVQRLRTILRSPTRHEGLNVTPMEWLCVVRGLSVTMNAMRKLLDAAAPSEDERDVWKPAFDLAERLNELREQHEPAIFVALMLDVTEMVLRRSAMDDAVIAYDFIHVKAPNPVILIPKFRLFRYSPQWTTLEVDGKPRRAFRCKTFFLPPGPNELSWPRDELGVLFGPEQLPVYIQRHAVQQVARRIQPDLAPLIMHCLEKPRFFKVDNGRFLVGLRLPSEALLGYFVGEVLGDKVLLKTFLFLTMQGTPQSDLLYKKLRLTRRDINYTQMDTLDFFADPQWSEDKELRAILDECGCGHLIDLGFDEESKELGADSVEALRNYLGDARLPKQKLQL